jgi:hypothetical protein
MVAIVLAANGRKDCCCTSMFGSPLLAALNLS